MKIDPQTLIACLRPTVALHEAMSCRQLFVLLVLKLEDKGEPVDFQVLVDKMQVRKPSVTRALDALEYDGMVWRTKLEDGDNRRSYLRLTVKGQEFIDRVLG